MPGHFEICLLFVRKQGKSTCYHVVRQTTEKDPLLAGGRWKIIGPIKGAEAKLM